MVQPERKMPGRPRVLVVDGDSLVTNLLGMLLERDGYEVSQAASGEEALEAAHRHPPDAVILEVRPGIESLETCRRLRRVTDAVILLAGPCGESALAVRGLQLGADDYLGKPYTYEILASKLRAGLNLRGRQGPPVTRRAGAEAGILMDASHRRVVVRDGRCVSLTRKEFELLQFLVENHDRVISADDILARVWGLEYVGDRDLVKQFIYRLRAKLEDDPAQPRSIVTVRGSGYAFEPPTKPSLRHLLQGASEESSRPAKPASVRMDSALPPPGEVSPAIPLGAPSARPPLFPTAPTRSVRRVFRLSPPGAVALGLLLAAVLSFGFVEGAQGALPGGRLYPLKIGVEGLHHALTLDPAERCSLHLEFARERIDEITRLLAEGRGDELSGALAAFEGEMLAASWAAGHPAQETSTGAASLRASLEAEARRHDEVLRGLLALAPEEARAGLEHALIVLNTGRGTIHALFIGVGAGAVSMPPADDTAVMAVMEGAEGTLQEWVGDPSSLPYPGAPATPSDPGSGHVQGQGLGPLTTIDPGGAPGTSGASSESQSSAPTSTPTPTPFSTAISPHPH